MQSFYLRTCEACITSLSSYKKTYPCCNPIMLICFKSLVYFTLRWKGSSLCVSKLRNWHKGSFCILRPFGNCFCPKSRYLIKQTCCAKIKQLPVSQFLRSFTKWFFWSIVDHFLNRENAFCFFVISTFQVNHHAQKQHVFFSKHGGILLLLQWLPFLVRITTPLRFFLPKPKQSRQLLA